MVIFQREGYEPQVYKDAYVYLVTFSFIFSNFLFMLWDKGELENLLDNRLKGLGITKTILRYYRNLFIEIIILAFVLVPLIIAIFIIGNLNHINFVLPLFIQAAWGMAVLSIRGYLVTLKCDKLWKELFIILFMFTVIILTIVFLYFYSQYGRLVITTVYDNDIPMGFFVNPLLTIVGLLYLQTGSPTYIGYIPVIYTIGFCVFIFILSLLLTIKKVSYELGGKNIAKSSSGKNIEKA
jgi:hypothetical protein